MNNQEIYEIIKANKSDYYSCDSKGFETEGSCFKLLEEYNGSNAFEVEKIFNHHFISAGKELIEYFQSITDQGRLGLSQDFLKNQCRGFKVEETCINMVLSGDNALEHPLHGDYEFKAILPEDHKTLQSFMDSCRKEDIEEAMIDLEDPDYRIILVYKDDIPVGYAGYRLWGSTVGDVGILIHHEHRKKGLASAAVAKITDLCLGNGHLPLYRASMENTGSVAVARRVGYTPLWESYEGVIEG
jgi:GNAT superfamily N-acetyltransferase